MPHPLADSYRVKLCEVNLAFYDTIIDPVDAGNKRPCHAFERFHIGEIGMGDIGSLSFAPEGGFEFTASIYHYIERQAGIAQVHEVNKVGRFFAMGTSETEKCDDVLSLLKIGWGGDTALYRGQIYCFVHYFPCTFY